ESQLDRFLGQSRLRQRCEKQSGRDETLRLFEWPAHSKPSLSGAYSKTRIECLAALVDSPDRQCSRLARFGASVADVRTGEQKPGAGASNQVEATPNEEGGTEQSTLPLSGAKLKLDRAAVRRFRLTVVEGPRTGTTVQSDSDRCSVGSHPLNQFVIDDPTVSRFHCEVKIGADGARVKDLDSLNGTIVDGVTIAEAFL